MSNSNNPEFYDYIDVLKSLGISYENLLDETDLGINTSHLLIRVKCIDDNDKGLEVLEEDEKLSDLFSDLPPLYFRDFVKNKYLAKWSNAKFALKALKLYTKSDLGAPNDLESITPPYSNQTLGNFVEKLNWRAHIHNANADRDCNLKFYVRFATNGEVRICSFEKNMDLRKRLNLKTTLSKKEQNSKNGNQRELICYHESEDAPFDGTQRGSIGVDKGLDEWSCNHLLSNSNTSSSQYRDSLDQEFFKKLYDSSKENISFDDSMKKYADHKFQENFESKSNKPLNKRKPFSGMIADLVQDPNPASKSHQNISMKLKGIDDSSEEETTLPNDLRHVLDKR